MNGIFDYIDYRKFLRDRYLELKAADGGYSYQKFSRIAGLQSPNYLKLIIDGKRDLTVANIHVFAKTLKLTEAETEFFEILVLSNQATHPLEKKFYKSRLMTAQSSKMPGQARVNLKNIGQFPYLPAIVVICEGLLAADAALKISERFRISEPKIRQVLSSLEKEGVIEIAEGRYRMTKNYFVQFDALRSNEDFKLFLKNQLGLSEQALKNRYSQDAQFFAHTFTCALERIPSLTKKIADLLEEVTHQSSEDPSECTMQMNIQLFRLETL